jgi:hypothetical protein
MRIHLETKEDYIKALQKHDWYYVYSDDHSVYLAGREQQEVLVEYARKHDPEGIIWNTICPTDCKWSRE